VLETVKSTSPDTKLVVDLGDVVVGTDYSGLKSDIEAVLGTASQTKEPFFWGVTGDHDGDGVSAFTDFFSYQASKNGGQAWNIYMDYADARFILLNLKAGDFSCAAGSPLHTAITTNPKKWLFAMQHYKGTAGDCDSVLEAAGMDAFFWGHAHSYAKTTLGSAVSINTGLGGCGNQYSEITVDGESATMRQIQVGGTVVDTVTIPRRKKPFE
jgi:predicted phosphodiesterase